MLACLLEKCVSEYVQKCSEMETVNSNKIAADGNANMRIFPFLLSHNFNRFLIIQLCLSCRRYSNCLWKSCICACVYTLRGDSEWYAIGCFTIECIKCKNHNENQPKFEIAKQVIWILCACMHLHMHTHTYMIDCVYYAKWGKAIIHTWFFFLFSFSLTRWILNNAIACGYYCGSSTLHIARLDFSANAAKSNWKRKFSCCYCRSCCCCCCSLTDCISLLSLSLLRSVITLIMMMMILLLLLDAI